MLVIGRGVYVLIAEKIHSLPLGRGPLSILLCQSVAGAPLTSGTLPPSHRVRLAGSVEPPVEWSLARHAPYKPGLYPQCRIHLPGPLASALS